MLPENVRKPVMSGPLSVVVAAIPHRYVVGFIEGHRTEAKKSKYDPGPGTDAEGIHPHGGANRTLLARAR